MMASIDWKCEKREKWYRPRHYDVGDFYKVVVSLLMSVISNVYV